MKKHFTLLFFGQLIFGVFTLYAQDPQNMKVENQILDCSKMKSYFANVEQAHEILESTTFAFTQELKTTKRFGVKTANYYSCDNENGYLLMSVDDKEILYKNYPRFQWKLLIETNDLDGFYAENIKGKYLIAVEGKQ